MNNNLQELYDFIYDAFPWIESKVIYKVLFCIQARLTKFNYIWFSRYEAYKFGISERKLRAIIQHLRDYWVLECEWMTLSTNTERLISWNYQKCNIYTIPEEFAQMFKSFWKFVKNVFEYINPILFMQRYFAYKEKSTYYSFSHKGIKYKIHKRGNFKWVIFDCMNKRIVNPYELLKGT